MNKDDYPDYPFSKRLAEELAYLDSKSPRAWKMRSRLNLIRLIEGRDADMTVKNMSQDLKYLINIGIYVGAKYNNNNKEQFYCKREWMNEDMKSMKDQYKPSAEDLQDIPLHKRGDERITWIIGGN